MSHSIINDQLITKSLASAKTIAMVGVSSIKKESKSNIFKRGSVIPITEILSISKQDSNPSEIIFCPPTPKNLAFGYLPFKECISFLPNSSPDFSPATTAILGFSNSFFLELDDINEQYHGKISL